MLELAFCAVAKFADTPSFAIDSKDKWKILQKNLTDI